MERVRGIGGVFFKAVDKAAVITDIRVETKTGGKSGDFVRPGAGVADD